MNQELKELLIIKGKIEEFINKAKAKGDVFDQEILKEYWDDFKSLLKTGNPELISDFVKALRNEESN